MFELLVFSFLIQLDRIFTVSKITLLDQFRYTSMHYFLQTLRKYMLLGAVFYITRRLLPFKQFLIALLFLDALILLLRLQIFYPVEVLRIQYFKKKNRLKLEMFAEHQAFWKTKIPLMVSLNYRNSKKQPRVSFFVKFV